MFRGRILFAFFLVAAAFASNVFLYPRSNAEAEDQRREEVTAQASRTL